MSERVFRARLRGVRGKNITYLLIPFSVEQVFHRRGRVPVAGTIDKVKFRSSVFPAAAMLKERGMAGKHFLVVNAKMREALRKRAGSSVQVTIDLDTRKRTVAIPPELKRRLGSARLLDIFNALPFTQRKEYIVWMEDAKKPETHERRFQMILSGLKRRKDRARQSPA